MVKPHKKTLLVSCVGRRKRITYTGFIVNLENLDNRPFFTKSQGKPELGKYCIIFVQVRSRPEKKMYLVNI